MIKLQFQNKIYQRYGQEIQTLCKTQIFGPVNDFCTGEIDQQLLKNIIKNTKEKVLLLSALVQSIRPSSQKKTASYSSQSLTYLQLVSMKIVAILVIFCQSAHRNDSNYILLMIALYMYSASAYVDVINLFNHFGLSVSYGVLQKNLKISLIITSYKLKNNFQIADLLDHEIILNIEKIYIVKERVTKSSFDW